MISPEEKSKPAGLGHNNPPADDPAASRRAAAREASRRRMAESRRRRAAGLALLTIEVPLGAVEDAVAEAALLPAHALDDLTRLAEAVGRVVTAWANGEPPPTVARNTTPGAEGR